MTEVVPWKFVVHLFCEGILRILQNFKRRYFLILFTKYIDVRKVWLYFILLSIFETSIDNIQCSAEYLSFYFAFFHKYIKWADFFARVPCDFHAPNGQFYFIR